MAESDDPLFSSDAVITAAMRVDKTIPPNWRYLDISWTPATVFDKIVEIGGEDMRILACSTRGPNKRGQVVFGPAAAQRVAEQRETLKALLESAMANRS